MRAPDSVREQVLTLLLAMVMLVTVVAGAGAVGVISLTEDVDTLIDDLRPAAYSNIALRNDLTQAQAGARGWALSQEQEFRRRFRQSVEDSRVELARLERLVAENPELTEAVDLQREAIEGWLVFGRELATGPGDADEVLESQELFDKVVLTNDAVSFTVNAAIDERGEHARDRGQVVMLVVALISLLGLAATALLCRSLVRRVSRPLHEMESAVELLAAGDLAARVPADGPREVRRVASALNLLAEENQEAREMEERVVSRLRELDRAKDDFVSTVSHELRTPLTSISGYVELFEEGLGDEVRPHQRGMLTVIQRNVARLRTLIEDLLTLSSVEAEAFRTSFDLCDVGALACEVVHDVASSADRAGVRVRLERPSEPVPVHGDPSQLSRAMLNVLSNAVKFSREGAEVLVEINACEEWATCTVRDRGIGIPAPELATLGTRFYRASNAVEAEIGGTGLGLRIVQTIADNHGGRLELESQEDEGTTARLVLPLAEAVAVGNIPAAQKITKG